MNTLSNHAVHFIDLGFIDYKEAWDYQTRLLDRILAVKSANRNRPEDDQFPTPNFLVFCEHPHVFTLGRNGNANNLLVSQRILSHWELLTTPLTGAETLPITGQVSLSLTP